MQSHAYNQLKHHIPQPLFKLTTSSVCPSPSSSCLSSPNGSRSASHGNQLNIRPVNSPSSSYFRPSTPRQKEKGKLRFSARKISSKCSLVNFFFFNWLQLEWIEAWCRSNHMKFTCFPKSSENEKAEKERKQSAERIQSLHTRLHQEAEKIRKWKTSTEVEMKEKVISDVMKSYDS